MMNISGNSSTNCKYIVIEVSTDFVTFCYTFRSPFSWLIFVSNLTYKLHTGWTKKCTLTEKNLIYCLNQPSLFIKIVYNIISCIPDNNYTIFPYCAFLTYFFSYYCGPHLWLPWFIHWEYNDYFWNVRMSCRLWRPMVSSSISVFFRP